MEGWARATVATTTQVTRSYKHLASLDRLYEIWEGLADKELSDISACIRRDTQDMEQSRDLEQNSRKAYLSLKI
jgi:hypothetical protein